MSTQSVGQHGKFGMAVLVCAFLTLTACMENKDERAAPAPPPPPGGTGTTTTTTATTAAIDEVVRSFENACNATGEEGRTARRMHKTTGKTTYAESARDLLTKIRLDLPFRGTDLV